MLCASTAQAADTKGGPSCSTLPKLAELENAGRLLEARQVAVACANPSCGTAVSQQCSARMQALELNLPSVVPIALDERRAPIQAVEVRVDGVVRSTQIDGRAILLDPGIHEFTFSAKDRVPYVEKLLVVQGERNRRLSAVLRPVPSAPAETTSAAPAATALLVASSAPATAPTGVASAASVAAPAGGQNVALEPAQHVSIWPYVAGGTALAAFGASIAFATWGHHDNELLDQCAPNCSQDSVDHVKNMYIAADVSLGVGVVALGVATWLYLSESTSPDARTDHAQQHLDVLPTKGGAFASWEHEF